MFQTLHAHTKISDGKLTHDEILNLCPKYNIDTIAFTEHDALPSIEDLIELKRKKYNTRWLIGIEISSGLPMELGGKIHSGCHILGLFVDPENRNLLDHCDIAQRSRVERMQKIVSNLNSLGFKITQNDCLKASGGESVGRPHIVTALNSKEENVLIIEEYFEKLKKEKDTNLTLKTLYDNISKSSKKDWPFYLFLSSDSYIPNIYVDYLYYKDFDASVKLIRDAGGIAILAHYFTISKEIDKNFLEKLVKEKRIDGLEVVFGKDPLDDENLNNPIDVERKIVKNLCDKYDCIKTGGADFHEERHLEELIKSKYANETVGLYEKLINRIDTKKDYFKYFNVHPHGNGDPDPSYLIN